ncbi:hypothetical protein DFQ27_005465 [Actinomortierella ambigua]|uniref:Glutamine amidotransferase domain-containing protein n=1 Tax=Actinomortierella ambigua TaxID=1343610 RepID=A0A9P6QM76_9FUNG|nr:hypothetical protein DFQ27_005465 [Actinomortierella ambigua]
MTAATITTPTLPTKHIKVALLVCGIPIPTVLEPYGDYTVIFRNLMLLGLDRLKKEGKIDSAATLELTGFDAREGVYPELIQDFDLVLISGSASDAYDNIPWINQLVEYVRTTTADPSCPKFAGICFGHQIIGRAFNAPVSKNPKGWELGWTQTELTKEGQEFWGGEVMTIQELHQDIVHTVPEGFSLLATNGHTANQSMISNNKKIVTLQGHPELTAGIMLEYIKARTASGIFSKELSEASIKVNEKPVDSERTAARILEFALA